MIIQNPQFIFSKINAFNDVNLTLVQYQFYKFLINKLELQFINRISGF